MPSRLQTEKSASFDINTAADKVTFYAHAKLGLREVGIIPTSTDAGGATIKFDITEQGETRGDGDAGTITVPASNSQYDVLREKPSASEVIVEAGSIITVQVTAESAAACSTAIAFIKFVELDDVADNLDDLSDA